MLTSDRAADMQQTRPGVVLGGRGKIWAPLPRRSPDFQADRWERAFGVVVFTARHDPKALDSQSCPSSCRYMTRVSRVGWSPSCSSSAWVRSSYRLVIDSRSPRACSAWRARRQLASWNWSRAIACSAISRAPRASLRSRRACPARSSRPRKVAVRRRMSPSAHA